MMTKSKILLVDDRRENIEALSQLIGSEEIEIHSAMSADAALELLTQHEFALALLDVQMPGMSGFELARLVRGVYRYRHLPIIFVTAHREDESVIFESYGSGAVDILFKPLDVHIVRSKVRVFVELSQQKALLQDHVRQLESLREQADAANLAKSQFLANMSHEIRTPLGAVMGFSEIVLRGEYAPGEKEECASAIRRNGGLLMRLIDDILDFSKIEAQRLEFEHVPFELIDIIEDVESTLSLKAHDKGVRLTLNVDEISAKTPRYIGDPLRIKQILLNIIGNAVKFTPRGGVTADFSIATVDSKAADRVCILVRDEGIGMTAEQAERLFQAFGQADPSTRRQFGGSGLGLIISRQLARAFGGDICLKESRPNQGSTFQITFELLHAPSLAGLPKVGSRSANGVKGFDFAGKSVLVVDDSKDNQKLLEIFLRPTGADLIFVNDGLSAVNAAQARQYDLILMDVQMPGMDGHEATQRIRQMNYAGPIIALTAHAVREEQDRCRADGCNLVITKPINRPELLGSMSAMFSKYPPSTI